MIKKISIAISVFILFAGITSQVKADQKTWKFFNNFEFYFPGNADDDVKNDLDEYLEELSAFSIDASGTINTKNGAGIRMGFISPLKKKNLELGGSLAYIIGPKIKATLINRDILDPGTITNKVQTDYIQIHSIAVYNQPLSKKAAFRIGVGAGLTQSHIVHTRYGTEFYDGSEFENSDRKIGFSSEIFPSLLFNFSRISWELGARYTQLPKIKRTDEHFEVDWNPFSIYLGLHF